MKVSISPSEREILRHVSQHGPRTAYELGKETRYSEKSSYQGVKNLLDKGLLSVSIVGKTRVGLDKKEYHLTLLGLSHVAADSIEYYSSDADAWPDAWLPIMETWTDLIPLVTDKWTHFVNEGVEGIARGKFLTAALRQMKGTRFLLSPGDCNTDRMRMFHHDFYYPDMSFYYPDIILCGLDEKEMMRWTEACAKDTEIADHLVMEMTRFLTVQREMGRIVRAMLGVLKDRNAASAGL